MATIRALLIPVSSFNSLTAALIGFSRPPLSIPPCKAKDHRVNRQAS